ncbi:hypothetical protein TKK_0015187 [Trichogramma kaykai]
MTTTAATKERGPSIRYKNAFSEAKKLMSWNKYLMLPLGLWPSKPNDYIFVTFFCFFYYHLFLYHVVLLVSIRSFSLMRIIGALMENVTMVQVFLRLYTMRRYNKEFGKILEEFGQDFFEDNYESNEEKRIFLSYNAQSKRFIRIVVISLGLTAMLYFTKPLIRQLSILKHARTGGKAFTYDLPYRIYFWYKIADLNIFLLTYVSQIPLLYTIGFTQTAMDCLTLTLVVHLCGQLGVLSERIRKIDFINGTSKLIRAIKRHQELISAGLMLRKIYRVCLLGHFLGAAISICTLIYQLLMSISTGQKTNLVTFFVYGFLNIFRLYTHCWAGEYLIHESIKVSNAFYQCEWYKLPVEDQKKIIFCIRRSQKALSLMAGNFGHFSLVTFTSIMKSAMAYLSFLRNFI